MRYNGRQVECEPRASFYAFVRLYHYGMSLEIRGSKRSLVREHLFTGIPETPVVACRRNAISILQDIT